MYKGIHRDVDLSKIFGFKYYEYLNKLLMIASQRLQFEIER